MNSFFVKQWKKNKNKLEAYYRAKTQDRWWIASYNDIMDAIITYVYNDEENPDRFSLCEEHGHDDWDGVLHLDFVETIHEHEDFGLSPEEIEEIGINTEFEYTNHYSVSMNYGSCSCCDTLLCAPSQPDPVRDLMTLSLHLVQRC